jgi:hypothetical protein
MSAVRGATTLDPRRPATPPPAVPVPAIARLTDRKRCPAATASPQVEHQPDQEPLAQTTSETNGQTGSTVGSSPNRLSHPPRLGRHPPGLRSSGVTIPDLPTRARDAASPRMMTTMITLGRKRATGQIDAVPDGRSHWRGRHAARRLASIPARRKPAPRRARVGTHGSHQSYAHPEGVRALERLWATGAPLVARKCPKGAAVSRGKPPEFPSLFVANQIDDEMAHTDGEATRSGSHEGIG